MARKQKKYHYIYKTTNLINGKYYIGMHSTDNVNDGYVGSGKRLWYSIKKYGKENFKCEILEMLPNRNSLKEKEKEIINEDLLNDVMCMNIQPGGGGGFSNKNHRDKFFNAALLDNLDKKRSKKGALVTHFKRKNDNEFDKKWRKSISDANKGNQNWLGKKHTEDTKRKIGETNSIKQKGENNSQFGSQWITNGKENKKIKKNDIILDGWKLGRVFKNNE
jgi:hypothetical protein